MKILFTLLLLFPAAAHACYTPREVEAEQGLRIQSELMVIGLTCQKTPDGAGAYARYQDFMRRHAPLAREYEETLIAYYRQNEKKLHTLRTNLANEISQEASVMGATDFCTAYSPRIDMALAMDEGQLRQWAQQAWPARLTSEPGCH